MAARAHKVSAARKAARATARAHNVSVHHMRWARIFESRRIQPPLDALQLEEQARGIVWQRGASGLARDFSKALGRLHPLVANR